MDCDVDATRQAYEQISIGGAEECGCSMCRNFIEVRQLVYPEECLHLFARLGINPLREVEVYHMTRLESGLHLYGGWFHFVGNILQQSEAPAKLDDRFTIDFIAKGDLAADWFENQPLVQVEITAEAPWVLHEEKEPN